MEAYTCLSDIMDKPAPVPMIEVFLDNQKVNGIKESTIKDQRAKLNVANEWKPLKAWKKDDITKYILHMQEIKNESTVEMTKIILKKFFKFHGKEKWIHDIKARIPKRKLKSTDILTPDDVSKMIDTADLNLHKALIAFLFESGARISEVLSIKVSDIQETPQGMQIFIPATKTGEDYRPCMCIYSGQYIRNHVLYPPLKKEDSLFKISKTETWRTLKELAEKAGIDKPISAHKFRHAQTMYMIRKGYQESIIRAQMGWTDDSKMIGRYSHVDGTDITNARLEKEGNNPIIQEQINNIKIASPISIADSSIELNRLQHDNEELQRKFAEQETQHQKDIEELKKTMIQLYKNLTSGVKPEDFTKKKL